MDRWMDCWACGVGREGTGGPYVEWPAKGMWSSGHRGPISPLESCALHPHVPAPKHVPTLSFSGGPRKRNKLY